MALTTKQKDLVRIAIKHREGNTGDADLILLERVYDLQAELEKKQDELARVSQEIKDLAADVTAVSKMEGPQGRQGAKGDTGPAGKNGKDGKDGKDGNDGKDGKDGKAGLNGKDGKDGKDGSGGGVGHLALQFAMAKLIKHQKFSTSSATTTLTLTNTVAGNVCIWFRYNGQMLHLGDQYTLSGTTITFTFTPDDDSVSEATYLIG